MFGCKGCGGGERHVGRMKINTSDSHLDVRGGGGRRCDKKTISSSHLNMREVAVVGETTSNLHLDAREVVVGGMSEKRWWW